MSQLRSVVAESTGFDPDDLTPAELAAEIVEALYVIQHLEVFVTGWVRNLTGRGGHHTLGYPSATSFLVDQGRMSGGHARQIVARAQARQKAPAAYSAWGDGRLSTDQAGVLFAAAESVPDSYPDAEGRLVEIVEPLTVSDTRKAVEYWRQAVDGPGEVGLETQLARRGISISKTSGGMRRVDGWLTQTAGEALETAIDALTPPAGEDDHRTPRQRRHDAVEDLCRDWLDHAETPVVGGEKPNITLICDLPALQGHAGGCHETLNGDVVDVDTLRMISCDCSVSRIVLGPDSEILDVGRKTRVWTTAQRRAIIARDRHCQADGCSRNHRWCDIHHIDHWADGGPTDIANGMLLCRYHHTKHHQNEKHRRRLRT